MQTLSNDTTKLAQQALQDALRQQQPGQGQKQKPEPTEPKPEGSTPEQKPKPEPTPEPKPTGPTDRPYEPKKPVVLGPQTRKLVFNFMFDTNTEMWGEYQVRLQDIQTMKEYIPKDDMRYANVIYMDVPSSIKGGVVVRIIGTVRPQKIEAPSDIEPRSWKLNIQTTEQFPTMASVSGFNVVAATKEVQFKLTMETENQKTTADTDTHQFGVTVKAEGPV